MLGAFVLKRASSSSLRVSPVGGCVKVLWRARSKSTSCHLGTLTKGSSTDVAADSLAYAAPGAWSYAPRDGAHSACQQVWPSPSTLYTLNKSTTFEGSALEPMARMLTMRARWLLGRSNGRISPPAKPPRPYHRLEFLRLDLNCRDHHTLTSMAPTSCMYVLIGGGGARPRIMIGRILK